MLFEVVSLDEFYGPSSTGFELGVLCSTQGVFLDLVDSDILAPSMAFEQPPVDLLFKTRVGSFPASAPFPCDSLSGPSFDIFAWDPKSFADDSYR